MCISASTAAVAMVSQVRSSETERLCALRVTQSLCLGLRLPRRYGLRQLDHSRPNLGVRGHEANAAAAGADDS